MMKYGNGQNNFCFVLFSPEKKHLYHTCCNTMQKVEFFFFVSSSKTRDRQPQALRFSFKKLKVGFVYSFLKMNRF